MSGSPRASVSARNDSITGTDPIPVTPLTCAREERVTDFGGTAGNAGNGLAFTVGDEFLEVVTERVAHLLAERQPQAAPELLTVDEAAEFLRCRRQRIYDLVSQDRLSHLKDGSRLLFRRADVLAYLEGQAA